MEQSLSVWRRWFDFAGQNDLLVQLAVVKTIAN